MSYVWTHVWQEAMDALKRTLTTKTVLVHPNFNYLFSYRLIGAPPDRSSFGTAVR